MNVTCCLLVAHWLRERECLLGVVPAPRAFLSCQVPNRSAREEGAPTESRRDDYMLSLILLSPEGPKLRL